MFFGFKKKVLISQKEFQYFTYSDFNHKIKSLKNICCNSILVTTDAVSFYPSILHESGLNGIKEALDNREKKSISTYDILKILGLVFSGKFKQQLPDAAIGTKCAALYACIFMDKVEADFAESQKRKPMVWFLYTDDIFYFNSWREEVTAVP